MPNDKKHNREFKGKDNGKLPAEYEGLTAKGRFALKHHKRLQIYAMLIFSKNVRAAANVLENVDWGIVQFKEMLGNAKTEEINEVNELVTAFNQAVLELSLAAEKIVKKAGGRYKHPDLVLTGELAERVQEERKEREANITKRVAQAKKKNETKPGAKKVKPKT